MNNISRCFVSIAFSLLLLVLLVDGQQPGSIDVVGDTTVGAMMMFVANEQKVYILDKVENNPTKINGHPAWAAEWDIASSKSTTMDVMTNPFCSSGMHLPNGSFATFGGNNAIGPGGIPVGQPYGELYGDYDGGVAVRILNPCNTTGGCKWYDDSSTLHLQRTRWYSTAEPLGDGSVAVIGGFVYGGYINRVWPLDNRCTPDPTQCGQSEPTYELFPPNGTQPKIMQFLVDTAGLNSYPHAFLMPSGKVFLQTNVSATMWDPATNQETRLPDMPNGVVRTYPASGAVAMLPLTPANNYTPTLLFCGGSDMPADAYGGYGYPEIDTWKYPASQDCHRITPEPADGSAPIWVKDDDMLEGRTMGQFIILPDGSLLIVNGGANGTAGYAQQTGQTQFWYQMPYGMSLASGPRLTPAVYDYQQPAGHRWSQSNFSASKVPRLYHSTAVLLPDASVLIAGSNPNADYNATTYFPTEHRAEKFYPSYFGRVRPAVTGIPSSLTYGGAYFNLTLPASFFSSDEANLVAGNATVVVIRQGFTTHAMNMGQRMLQLNNTFTVMDDGSITLHVSQLPPNPNLFTPGPAFIYVLVNGVPSDGKSVIVGSGKIEKQPTSPQGALPASIFSQKIASGPTSGPAATSKALRKAVLVAGIIALLILIALGLLVYFLRRSKSKKRRARRSTFISADVHELEDPAYGGKYDTVKDKVDVSGVDSSVTLIPVRPKFYDDREPYSYASTSAASSRPESPAPMYNAEFYDPYKDQNTPVKGEFERSQAHLLESESMEGVQSPSPDTLLCTAVELSPSGGGVLEQSRTAINMGAPKAFFAEEPSSPTPSSRKRASVNLMELGSRRTSVQIIAGTPPPEVAQVAERGSMDLLPVIDKPASLPTTGSGGQISELDPGVALTPTQRHSTNLLDFGFRMVEGEGDSLGSASYVVPGTPPLGGRDTAPSASLRSLVSPSQSNMDKAEGDTTEQESTPVVTKTVKTIYGGVLEEELEAERKTETSK